MLSRVFLLALLVGFAFDLPSQAKETDPNVVIVETASGPVRFSVEIADDNASRAKGLMFRTSLASDHGMLFDFHTPQQVGFWMKNCLIPIDMLFINADGHIVNIHANAKPGDETSIPSAGPIRGVLELMGGTAAARGIQPGDVVRHPIFP